LDRINQSHATEQSCGFDKISTVVYFFHGLCLFCLGHGFNHLYWNEVGWQEWRTIGKETEVWEEKKLFIYGTPDSKYRGSKYSRMHY
jgi:hypothetical protein